MAFLAPLRSEIHQALRQNPRRPAAVRSSRMRQDLHRPRSRWRGQCRIHERRISDVMARYFGESEANLHSSSRTARANAPVVLFLDEIDAMGMRRSHAGSCNMHSITNILMELDGIGSDNEGVFVPRRHQHPLGRGLRAARPGTLRPRRRRSLTRWPRPTGSHHAPQVPSVKASAWATSCSAPKTGADLAHLVASAVRRGLARTGNVRMVTMHDFLRALEQIRPALGPGS